MTVLRVVLEAERIELRDGEVGGFFTAEVVRGHNPEVAIQQATNRWEAQRGVRPGRLVIVDSWRAGFFDAFRRRAWGFIMFDSEARADAADVIADAAHAPKNAAIRRIAVNAA